MTDFPLAAPPPDALVQTFTAHSFDVDLSRRLSPIALLRYLQEAAWNHAEQLGVGFGQLGAKKLLWVLSRQRIRMAAFPEWGTAFSIATWPAGRDRRYAYRDFLIRDPDGALLGSATTAWFAIDFDSRRPVRPDIYFTVPTPGPEWRADSEPLEKLEGPGDCSPDRTVTVYSTDLDVNGHVNHVRYLEWMLSVRDPGRIPLEYPARIELNYLAECHPGDRLELRRQDDGGAWRMNLRREGDGKPVCVGNVTWRENNGTNVAEDRFPD